jgi:acyl carrier protein
VTIRADRLAAEDVLGVVRSAVSVVLEVDPDSVERSTVLRDIGVDSLALVAIAEIVEERVSGQAGRPLHIPDTDLERMLTVGDTVDYVIARI